MFRVGLILAALIGDGALLVADAAGGDPNAFFPYANLGFAGALIVLLISGQLRRAKEVIEADKRTEVERKRAEDAEARERAMAETLRNEVVPAMVRFTDIASRLLDREH